MSATELNSNCEIVKSQLLVKKEESQSALKLFSLGHNCQRLYFTTNYKKCQIYVNYKFDCLV